MPDATAMFKSCCGAGVGSFNHWTLTSAIEDGCEDTSTLFIGLRFTEGLTVGTPCDSINTGLTAGMVVVEGENGGEVKMTGACGGAVRVVGLSGRTVAWPPLYALHRLPPRPMLMIAVSGVFEEPLKREQTSITKDDSDPL